MLKEIRPKPKLWPDQSNKQNETCPMCKGKLWMKPISCPEGKEGCLVLHLALVCNTCGRAWSESK